MQQYKAKILLVEDDASLGFVIKDNLEDAGYEVIYCNDGESGWQQFMRHNVDICLLDVMLPKKDGMTLAIQIRKKNTQVPILFMTAKSMEEDRIAGFKAGGDDYITKPFNMQEMLLRIEVFLKHTKKNNEEEQKNIQYRRLSFRFCKFDTSRRYERKPINSKRSRLVALSVRKCKFCSKKRRHIIKCLG